MPLWERVDRSLCLIKHRLSASTGVCYTAPGIWNLPKDGFLKAILCPHATLQLRELCLANLPADRLEQSLVRECFPTHLHGAVTARAREAAPVISFHDQLVSQMYQLMHALTVPGCALCSSQVLPYASACSSPASLTGCCAPTQWSVQPERGGHIKPPVQRPPNRCSSPLKLKASTFIEMKSLQFAVFMYFID